MLIDDLRAATQDHHRRTEAAFDLKAACASRDTYGKLLDTMLGMYRPLEAALDTLPLDAAGMAWSQRRKVELLERDLRALGHDPTAVERIAVDSVPMASIADAIGVLYLLEGSTLGGQFIRKHVARTLALDATNGCAFFIAYDDQTPRMWAEFIDIANRTAVTEPDRAAACTAAKATFDLFERSLRARACAAGGR